MTTNRAPETTTKEDFRRMDTQRSRLEWILTNHPGKWWTLRELGHMAVASETGISARLRDMRKDKYGGYDIQAENTGKGLWRYRIAVEENTHE